MLIQLAFRILTKPRKTAKDLLEENAINLALWFFLISTIVTSITVLPLIDSLRLTNIWFKGIYIFGFSLLGSSLSLLIPSIFLNLFCIVVKGRCDFKGTLLSMAWTLGPGLLLEVPTVLLYFLLNLAFWKGQLILSEEIVTMVLNILEQITFWTLLVKIPIQIVFLVEVYKISIFKVVIIHIATLIFLILGWICIVVLLVG